MSTPDCFAQLTLFDPNFSNHAVTEEEEISPNEPEISSEPSLLSDKRLTLQVDGNSPNNSFWRLMGICQNDSASRLMGNPVQGCKQLRG